MVPDDGADALKAGRDLRRVLVRAAKVLQVRRPAWVLLVLIGSCCLDTGEMGESSTTGGGGLPAEAGCPYCTPGAPGVEDGVCVDSCPPGGSAESSSPGTHCAFGPSCATGLSVCGGGSFPCLATDPSNCGTCGHACGAGEECKGGACSVSCGEGLAKLGSDPSNCGTCGNVCPPGQVCGGGVCGAPCAPTPANCTGIFHILPDGGLCPTCPSCKLGISPVPTCVDATSDSNNCGACGHVCGLGEICSVGECQPACSAGQVCGGGACQPSCPVGTSPCPGANGGSTVCVDLRNDANNCGSCGNACPGCIAGSCVLTCPYGVDAG